MSQDSIFRHMEVEIDPRVEALMQEATAKHPKRTVAEGNPSPDNLVKRLFTFRETK